MDGNVIAVCVTVVTIGGVLCVALYRGIDGAILGAGLTVIGTILGYLLKAKVDGQVKPSTSENNS